MKNKWPQALKWLVNYLGKFGDLDTFGDQDSRDRTTFSKILNKHFEKRQIFRAAKITCIDIMKTKLQILSAFKEWAPECYRN